MNELYQQIETLIPKLHGWCTPEKGSMIAASVMALRPQTTVVIGVWGGRDTFAAALAHKECGRGSVIGIDPWSASASIQGQTDANYDWWAKIDHEVVYRDFLKHVGQLGLTQIIRVERMISDYFDPPENIGFLIVDGNHGPQAERDVDRFASRVERGKLCLLDDLDWQGGAVRRAREKLLGMGFVSLYRIDTSEMFQRL